VASADFPFSELPGPGFSFFSLLWDSLLRTGKCHQPVAGVYTLFSVLPWIFTTRPPFSDREKVRPFLPNCSSLNSPPSVSLKDGAFFSLLPSSEEDLREHFPRRNTSKVPVFFSPLSERRGGCLLPLR